MAQSASTKSDASEYSTTTVESHADGWTAKISRFEPGAETTSGYVNVGSISHLISSIGPAAPKKDK